MSLPLGAKAECWVWFTLAISSVILRFMSQYIIRKHKFLSDIPVDDVLMLILVFTYTTAIAALYKYFDIAVETEIDALTPEENFAIGRKLGIINILAETAIQTTLWGNKCCLLLLYDRLALFGHYHNTLIFVATYTGLAYLAVIVALYGGWCRPFSDYMELNPRNVQCLTWTNYNILQITMNLSTDLILLLIPVTLISQLKMRIGKKLLLICLFSMGVFVMLCATLMKVTVFTNPTNPVWFLWSVREVSMTMLVGNLVLSMPILRTLWRCFVPGAGDSMGDKPSIADSGATSTVTKSGARDPAVSAASEPSASRPVPPTRVAINSVYTDVDIYGEAGPGSTSQRISLGQESV
ncbi:uncharacterized protein LY79DRAFT_6038 [Colletotrichum navitas]|uniref:Rhodopsin domain-containing protein n=1 Tax=Colletotrichum navitas TaxID=681940 RepID=A0AAD8QD06_9PEZI|nr:uncharacterized protein LY79DRAFT_6038 [Colletotrichum navitas]KAK1600085.1 hypothetical protein LY79DRAFT_6038 [Colletotrichum navitas]